MHRFLLFYLCMCLFFFLKQFDSIDFLNCICFICHKGVGQPKVTGGESTATLSKPNKLNSHVRNIEHWGPVSRSRRIHKSIKLCYNFPNVTCSSISVYKRSPTPSSLSHFQCWERRQRSALRVYANGLIWMLNALQQPCSLLQCISSLHVYDPSLFDSGVEKHLLGFFFLSKTMMWILQNTFTNEKKSKWIFAKKWGGERRCCIWFDKSFLIWGGIFFLFHFPRLLMKFLKMRWVVVAIET